MCLRDSCYFCTSTYQLLPIISLAIQRKEEADIYIDPDFEKAYEYADKLRKLNIFCNVVVIDSKSIYNKLFTTNKGLLYKIQTAFSYLRVNEIARMVLIQNVHYNNMFVSSNAYFPRIVYFYFIKNNISTQIKYFDDGIGSYLGNHAYTTILPERIIRRVLFGNASTSFSYERFLFSPDLFHLLNKNISVDIHKIPKVWEEEPNRKIFNVIFLDNNKLQIEEQVIILDEPKYEIVSNRKIDSLIELYRIITDIAGKDNTIIKRHPRCKDNKIEFMKYFADTGMPFECICMNTDMANKILISYESTAVVTPKILFNQEPVIILLYKLIKEKAVGGYDLTFEDKFFSTIKKTYTNQDRFIIPNNIEELKFSLFTLFKDRLV